MKTALIVFGGWEGHQPREVAELFAADLKTDGFKVELSDTLEAFNDGEKLKKLNLIIPCWTMGNIKSEQSNNVLNAVAGGVGLAGVHGGMCDAFRSDCGWQFMTGGQFVAHPGNTIKYPVHVLDRLHPIMAGINDFVVETEQYYMHVDPAIKVLATTPVPTPGAEGPHSVNPPAAMPVVWTKMWGQGRVFYNSLGHDRAMVESEPCRTIDRRGFAWTAR